MFGKGRAGRGLRATRIVRKTGGLKPSPFPRTKGNRGKKVSGIRSAKKPKKKKEKSISKLIKEADTLFSKLVRGENADENGICTCYTCGHRAELRRVQCGHLISRWYKIVRWDRDNARVQCWVCNIYKKGDSINFRRRLIQEIGKERVEAAEEKCALPFKLTREHLLDIIAKLSLSTSPLDSDVQKV